MKRLNLFLSALILFAFTSCENPDKSRYYMDQGATYMMRYAQYDKAEESLDKAIKYDKHNYEAYYYRGCVKVNEKKYKEGIVDFEKAVELKPDYADAYFNIGKVYFLLNDEDKACEYFKLADKYGRPNLEDYLRRCK